MAAAAAAAAAAPSSEFMGRVAGLEAVAKVALVQNLGGLRPLGLDRSPTWATPEGLAHGVALEEAEEAQRALDKTARPLRRLLGKRHPVPAVAGCQARCRG